MGKDQVECVGGNCPKLFFKILEPVLGGTIVRSFVKENIDDAVSLSASQAPSQKTFTLASIQGGHNQWFIDGNLTELRIPLFSSVDLMKAIELFDDIVSSSSKSHLKLL